MDDRDTQFVRLMAQLNSIPGVTRLEAQMAARILAFVDSRERTSAQEEVIATVFEKLKQYDSGLTRAYKTLADDVHSFISYVAMNNKGLSPEEVILVVAAIIHAFPELFEDNSAMHECLKDAAVWVKRKKGST